MNRLWKLAHQAAYIATAVGPAQFALSKVGGHSYNQLTHRQPLTHSGNRLYAPWPHSERHVVALSLRCQLYCCEWKNILVSAITWGMKIGVSWSPEEFVFYAQAAHEASACMWSEPITPSFKGLAGCCPS